MLSLMLSAVPSSAQDNAKEVRKMTDELFSGYSGKKGFTSISYSGKMLTMITVRGEDPELSDLVGNIDLIRILIEENPESGQGVFFLRDLAKLERAGTLVSSVNESGKDIRFYFKRDKDGSSCFLMVSRNQGKVTVLNILGKFDVKDIKKLSAVSGKME